jgi:hypothetical protein
MVYIDSFNAPYRRMQMCHMLADNTTELLLFAEAIGVNLKWVQYPGTRSEHFDICQSRKKIALALGAKEVTLHEMGEIMSKRLNLWTKKK